MKRAAPEKNIVAEAAAAVGQTSVHVAESPDALRVAATVRVSPTGYFAALFCFSLIAGFLFYLGQFTAGSFLLTAAWLALLPLAWFDRVKFDGQAVSRTGFLPRFWNKLTRQPQRLKLADIEHIETQAIRALRSGGRVFYRYRCEVRGGDQFFAFASGGAAFRQFVRTFFSAVLEDKLDARSLELRDYLASSKDTEKIVSKLQLPSADVAENALKTSARANDKMRQIKRGLRHAEHRQSETAEHLHLLRQVANQLRLDGNFAQSLEAFRRALFVAPADGWLLLEFSRGLHSYASSARQKQLLRRAFAALRLAVRHGFDNARLLVRIGESYFQFGDYRSAEKVFRRALEIEKDNFRALHGLAEVALNEGKLAHVAHNYQAAASTVSDEALKQWAHNEAEYFTLLNFDEDYMEAELMRINWLHSADRGSRICLRLTIVGLMTVLVGSFFDAQIAQLGLAIAGATAILWLLLSFAVGVLAARSPIDEDDGD